MTHPDFPDWQQNVATLDTATDLANGGQNIANNGTLGPYDVSQIASVAVNLAPPFGLPGDRWAFRVDFLEQAGAVSLDTLTMHSAESYLTGLETALWTMPVRGSLMVLRCRASVAGNAVARILGYTRPIPAPAMTAIPSDIGRVLLSSGSTSVPAGNTFNLWVPPARRAVSLRLNAMSPTTQVNVQGCGEYNGVLGGFDIARYLGTNAVQTVNELVVPMVGLEIGLQNTDTIAHPMGLTVFDVS